MIFILLASPLAAESGAGSAQTSDIAFAPPPGQRLPPDLALREESGQRVPLSSLLQGQPALLVPVYFECPNLCPYTLNGLLSALRALSLTAGRDFQVLVVSIDPHEGPDLAAAKRALYLKAYRRPDGDPGWHFLTGNEEDVRRFTRAIGFRSAADPAHHAFAHAAGLVVLAPDGRITRFFSGVEFEPHVLRLALAEARGTALGRRVPQRLVACTPYDPARSPHTLAILRLLRVAATASALTLFAGIGALLREDRRRRGAA